MEVREYLNEVRRSKTRMEALLERRRACAEMASWRSGGRSEALDALRREVDRRIDAVAEQALEAERRIDALDSAGQREVMRYRYLNGWEWKEIARRMNYSTDWVKHVHTRALKEMEARVKREGGEKRHEKTLLA